MCPDSLVDSGAMYLLTYLLTYVRTYFFLLPSLLYTFLRIGPLRFQAGGCKRRPNLASVFAFILYCSIFCCMCMFTFDGLDSAFQ